MRHKHGYRKLSRTSSHRKALLKNMAIALIEREKIETTVPKAKELSKLADRLVTLALRDDLHARRQAYKILENHQLVKKLFDEIGPRFHGVQGGYTRVVKFALPRLGDAAPMAIIEFTRTAEKQTEQPHESDNTEKIEEVEKAE